MSGVADGASGEHIVRSDDGRCALWVGAVDDLWQLGKPRGQGGPWLETVVKANKPSDAYLATGYDQKRLSLSHAARESVSFRVEADFIGTGHWHEVTTLAVKPDQKLEHTFPAAFGAYWLRVVADRDTTATAMLHYE
mgnify:CR=1 FL=1